MGGPAGGLESVNDTEWLSEVRAGRKKAAVLRDAEKVFQVCSRHSTSFCSKCGVPMRCLHSYGMVKYGRVHVC